MTYFSMDDMAFIADITPGNYKDDSTIQNATDELLALHDQLHAQLKTRNIPLHVTTIPEKIITLQSVTSIEPGGSLSVPYTRSKGEALTVERLMGRESVANARNLNARRHPTIELRMTADHLVIELVISPDAWWDQQNLVGKLTVDRHKQDLYAHLQTLDVGYRLGFWQGVALGEMHLTAAQFQHPAVMNEWMSTFEAGKDWFRLGIWHEWDTDDFPNDNPPQTLADDVQALYPIYEWIAWTSDNNYRDFYEK